jgi:hypothetical protein
MNVCLDRTRSGTRHLVAIISASLTALLCCAPAFAQGVPKQTFPRLGGYQIGKMPYEGSYSDPEYHRDLAKLDYVIFGSQTAGIDDDARAIRKLNPKIILAKYSKLQSIPIEYKGYAAVKRDKVSSERGPNNSNASDWWARDFDGNNVSNWPNNWTVNITKYVNPDSNGDRFPEWAAKLDYEWWLQYDVWDAIYEDAVYWQPRTPSSGKSVDWSGGKETDQKKIKSAFRLGHQAFWNKLKELAPNKYVFVNHDWYRSELPSALGRWELHEYDQQVHGGLLELVMRSSDLVKPRTPWDRVMFFYRRSMDYFLDPDITMFVVEGEPDNYRFFRYSFATCLMNDGYFDYAPVGSYQYGTVEWFDEFDLAGNAGTDWLGLALDPPPRAAWKSGVWRRDFEAGTALVNPKGNGKVSVSIESGFRRIDGRQDPTVNNGKPAGTITLQDGDGIILVRENAVIKKKVAPKPPTLMAE